MKGNRDRLAVRLACLIMALLLFPVSLAAAEDAVPELPDFLLIAQDPIDIHFDGSLWKDDFNNLIPEADTLCNRAVFSSLLSSLGVSCTPVRFSSYDTDVVPATWYRYLIRKINLDCDCMIVRTFARDEFRMNDLLTCYDLYLSDPSYSPVYLWGSYGARNATHAMLLLRIEDTERKGVKRLWLFDPSLRTCGDGHIVSMNVNFNGICFTSSLPFYAEADFQFQWVVQWRRLDMTDEKTDLSGIRFYSVEEAILRNGSDKYYTVYGTLGNHTNVQVTDYERDEEGRIWYQLDSGLWVLSEFIEEKR